METAVDVPKEETIGGISKWKVEGDLRSLRDADKIRRDSKRLGAVKLLVDEELGALAKIAGENKEGLGSSMTYKMGDM